MRMGPKGTSSGDWSQPQGILLMPSHLIRTDSSDDRTWAVSKRYNTAKRAPSELVQAPRLN